MTNHCDVLQPAKAYHWSLFTDALLCAHLYRTSVLYNNNRNDDHHTHLTANVRSRATVLFCYVPHCTDLLVKLSLSTKASSCLPHQSNNWRKATLAEHCSTHLMLSTFRMSSWSASELGKCHLPRTWRQTIYLVYLCLRRTHSAAADLPPRNTQHALAHFHIPTMKGDDVREYSGQGICDAKVCVY